MLEIQDAVLLRCLAQIAAVEVPTANDETVVGDETRTQLHWFTSDLEPGQRQTIGTTDAKTQQFKTGGRGGGNSAAEPDHSEADTTRGRKHEKPPRLGDHRAVKRRRSCGGQSTEIKKSARHFGHRRRPGCATGTERGSRGSLGLGRTALDPLGIFSRERMSQANLPDRA
jgi:hypothetical protein